MTDTKVINIVLIIIRLVLELSLPKYCKLKYLVLATKCVNVLFHSAKEPSKKRDIWVRGFCSVLGKTWVLVRFVLAVFEFFPISNILYPRSVALLSGVWVKILPLPKDVWKLNLSRCPSRVKPG